MSIGMFVIGFIIFSGYVYFLIWNIYYSSRKQKEENYPDLVDDMDMDGMGNFSRFPTDVTIEKRKVKKKEYETTRRTKK
jgi:hypothetical protein